jgi:hypothetical protein
VQFKARGADENRDDEVAPGCELGMADCSVALN